MEKFSVKKPFTVLVAVIMVLMLGLCVGHQDADEPAARRQHTVPDGGHRVSRCQPGACGERGLGRAGECAYGAGREKITATSAENYSLLLMQFVDDTDMNSALVQVSNKLDQAKSDLPETCTDPLYHSVQPEHERLYDRGCQPRGQFGVRLSDFIKNTMSPYSSARAACPAYRPAALWSSWCRCS